ncbi:hypothetical protein [uncultured Algoriphagus sp.]|uniref:hypothetical protein n=1 Tax=uncultured Algoriphagus sp. TaxID=417365 RepID=UPI0030EC9977
MSRPILFFVIFITLLSCDKKENSVTDVQVLFEKVDSIQINYLGSPTVHDLDPLSQRVVFMEHSLSDSGHEIFIADFDGNILSSFIKDGDTRDTYGHIMAPLAIDGENSFMAYSFNGFIHYDFDGNLISRVKIVDFFNPGGRILGMGYGMEKWEGKYFYVNRGSKNADYGDKDFFDEYHTMYLLDPSTGIRESIIPFPENSLFMKGNFFFSRAWEPVFHISESKLYIVFGLEPVIYIYENQAPFNLISSIPIELPDYHYFKGSEKYNNEDVRFFGHRVTSGKISNIKYVDNYFVLSYFPGFDAADTEMSISTNTGPDFWNAMRKKYTTRIAILDSQGKVLNDFVPEGLSETSMKVKNGELWMMGKPNGEVELDYFQLFKVGLTTKGP